MTDRTQQSIRALDMFAGVGGSSCGAVMAGVDVVAAIDTWTLARKTYRHNFKDVIYYKHKCETLALERVQQEVGSIQLLIASPECTNHTCAKGSAERSEQSRKTAFQVVRFATAMMPRWIIVENVIQMRGWKRYKNWKNKLTDLGYNIREQVLNSADFNVPQSRKRLFVICDLEAEPPLVKSPQVREPLPADSIITKNGAYRFSLLRSDRRAEATLQRADRAIAELGNDSPFLLVYYGSDGAGGWQKVDAPLRTITTVDRFAYVRPDEAGQHEMRMLQVPELKKSHGLPGRFQTGTRHSS